MAFSAQIRSRSMKYIA